MKKVTVFVLTSSILFGIAFNDGMQANAAVSLYSYITTVRVGNAPLRELGYDQAAVICTMNAGDEVVYYPYIMGSDPEYNEVYYFNGRTFGYVDHHYLNV